MNQSKISTFDELKACINKITFAETKEEYDKYVEEFNKLNHWMTDG